MFLVWFCVQICFLLDVKFCVFMMVLSSSTANKGKGVLHSIKYKLQINNIVMITILTTT